MSRGRQEPRGRALLPPTEAARVVRRGKRVPVPSCTVLGGRGCLEEDFGFGEALMASARALGASVYNDRVTGAGSMTGWGSQATARSCPEPGSREQGPAVVAGTCPTLEIWSDLDPSCEPWPASHPLGTERWLAVGTTLSLGGRGSCYVDLSPQATHI